MRRVAGLLVALAFWAAAAAAQDSSVTTGTIRGTVYDSLLHSPLAGAHISLLNGTEFTLSDQRGRFVLQGVPAGRQVVTFERPDLDSIGLWDFSKPATVTPGRETTVALAVPSLKTYWKAACGGPRPGTMLDSGVVFGTVTDAETRTRLAGARVTISWVTVERDARTRLWMVERPFADVRTDSLGSYYLCGVPTEYLFTARTQAGRSRSGLIEAIVDIRGITRRDLAVSREAVAAPDSTPSGEGRGLAVVAGTVRGERGGVLPGVVASVDGAADTVRTDSVGRFVLRNMPSGTHMLMLRRIGYFASRQALDLRNRDTTTVSATLQEATVLDTIRVTASPRVAALVEEIDYRRRSGFGYLIGTSEVRQRPSVRSLFDGVPSVQAIGSPMEFTLWVRSPLSLLSSPVGPGAGLAGFCRAHVVIDGWPADEEQLWSLTTADIMAVEIYPRQTVDIGRYVSAVDNCGVVLVWTIWARKPGP